MIPVLNLNGKLTESYVRSLTSWVRQAEEEPLFISLTGIKHKLIISARGLIPLTETCWLFAHYLKEPCLLLIETFTSPHTKPNLGGFERDVKKEKKKKKKGINEKRGKQGSSPMQK